MRYGAQPERDAVRVPDRAVLGVAFPVAVAVEVFGAGHLGRDIGVGVGLGPAVLRLGPLGRSCRARRRTRCSGSRRTRSRTAHAGPRSRTARCPATRTEDRRPRRWRGWRRLGGRRGSGRRVDGTKLPSAVATSISRATSRARTRTRQAAALPRGCARSGRRARTISSSVAPSTRIVVEPTCSLGARIGVGGQAVAGGERAVALRQHPLALLAVVDPDRAVQVGEAADAARRVGPCGSAQHQQRQRRNGEVTQPSG